MSTDERLREIRERLKKAGAGAGTWDDWMRFSERARQDMAWLLEEVERLRGEIESA